MSRSVPVVRLVVVVFLLSALVQPALAQTASSDKRLGPLARGQLKRLAKRSTVIIETTDETSLDAVDLLLQQAGGEVRRRLRGRPAKVVDLPNAALAVIAEDPRVKRISLDRPIVAARDRTGITIGAAAIRDTLGFDGNGVGVAVIDSGVTSWHDDLTASGGGQRVTRFVDFVNGRETAYDDYGHGTHVAGIIGGNGFDSGGRRTGVAPGASLVVLKALDSAGHGRISDVIAALDYVVENKDALNIRIVNLSVATGVFESYDTDPLTLAAKRAVDAGIVVVAAAGNNGRGSTGRDQYAGITAPGNAPWVITVGASSHQGTPNRTDDVMAAFSSRGPSAINYGAKPDLVAPGVGIESLSDPESAFYTSRSPYLLAGTVPTTYLPYLSLSGTSMAAPVVTGTVALMLQANPTLTPNAVKAILQYTSQIYSAYDPLTQGAGFLNAKGAVELAQYLAPGSAVSHPSAIDWGMRIIWGNQLFAGGRLSSDANAWLSGVTWGAATTPGGASVEWGLLCSSVTCDADDATWMSWRPDVGESSNVVWGATCGGANCSTDDVGNPVVWSVSDDDTVVWGTTDADTVVWGTADDDTVVWGTNDDTVVWGTSCGDPTCEPVVWPDDDGAELPAESDVPSIQQ
jgi:serine protease AprX